MEKTLTQRHEERMKKRVVARMSIRLKSGLNIGVAKEVAHDIIMKMGSGVVSTFLAPSFSLDRECTYWYDKHTGVFSIYRKESVEGEG